MFAGDFATTRQSCEGMFGDAEAMEPPPSLAAGSAPELPGEAQLVPAAVWFAKTSPPA